jgi:hypothetical protein
MFEFSETYWTLGGGASSSRPVYLAAQLGAQGQLELTVHSARAETFPTLEAAERRRGGLLQSGGTKGVDGANLRPLQVEVMTRIREAEEAV